MTEVCVRAQVISSLEDHRDEFGFYPEGDEKTSEILSRGVSRMIMFEKITLDVVKRNHRKNGWKQADKLGGYHGNQVKDASESCGRRPGWEEQDRFWFVYISKPRLENLANVLNEGGV